MEWIQKISCEKMSLETPKHLALNLKQLIYMFKKQLQ